MFERLCRSAPKEHMGTRVKSGGDIAKLAELGKRHADVLARLRAAAQPGVTTAELETLACTFIAEHGDRPAFKNYRPHGAPRPFPCALCVAPNTVVVHGIPTDPVYTLREGDIVGLDVGVECDGLFIDAGCTVPVGTIDAAAERLLAVTKEALRRGIAAARSGMRTGDIGHAIETYVRGEGYGLVRDLCGHGVGYAVHEDPQVPNYGEPGVGDRLVPGMVLAIEPMVNEGSGAVRFDRNWYTVHTRDQSRSAHFEHDIVITDGEPIVLTQW